MVVLAHAAGVASGTGGDDGLRQVRIPLPGCGTLVRHVEGLPCPCDCHTHRPTGTLRCYTCCPVTRKKLNIAACRCLCHVVPEVDCGDLTYACCDAPRSEGETDSSPHAPTADELDGSDIDEDLGRWPFDRTLYFRQQEKGQGRSMNDTFHLRMTLEGHPEEVDMFHLLLFSVDPGYPVIPMRKLNDLTPFCTRCDGMVWKGAIMTPEEIRKAARQAGVRVKIHSYRKGYKCGAATLEHRSLPPVLQPDPPAVGAAGGDGDGA